MPRGKKHGPEEVIPKLREAEVLISQGSTQEIAAKQIGVTKQTLIRWRKEYGGFRMDQAKRMKQLEKEDAKLKKLLAEAELDKAILKEAGQCWGGLQGSPFVLHYACQQEFCLGLGLDFVSLSNLSLGIERNTTATRHDPILGVQSGFEDCA